MAFKRKRADDTVHVFGSFIRPFSETAPLVDTLDLLLDHSPAEELGSGSFGTVKQFGKLFVYKKFQNINPYSPTVLETLDKAKQNKDDKLNEYIVWSYDSFHDFKDGRREIVIMEPITPLYEYIRSNMVAAERESLMSSLTSWLNKCTTELERHNLFCPDLKSANMGVVVKEVNNSLEYDFRLIDTDGIISGTTNDIPRYQSTYVRLDTDEVNGIRIYNWIPWLTEVHCFIKEMMAFEVKFHNRKAAYTDIDPFFSAYDRLISETKYFLPVQNDNPITIVAESLLKPAKSSPF